MAGWLSEMNDRDKTCEIINKRAQSFSASYDYWMEQLYERSCRLFEWKGPDDDGVPSYELEAISMRGGKGFLTKKYKNELTFFNGGYAGSPTAYYDRFEKFSVRSPKFSAVLKVGKDGVVLRNTALMTSILPLCHKYATLLSHTEVTYINTMINGRDAGGVPVASTKTQKKAIEDYRNDLCNGKVMSILDPAFSGVQFIETDRTTALSPLDVLECRDKLISAFYNDIGVRTVWNKRGNLIQSEVTGSDPMLLLNLKDMLAQRKKFCEEVNALYGTNWSVDIAEELKYDEQEESKNEEPNDSGNVENKQQE